MNVDKAFQFSGGFFDQKKNWVDDVVYAVCEEDDYISFITGDNHMLLAVKQDVAKELFAKLLVALNE